MKSIMTVLACAALLAAQSGWASDGFDDIFTQDEPGEAQVTGRIALDLRYFLDDGWDSAVDVSPGGFLNITASSGDLEGTLALGLEVDNDNPPIAMGDVVDELYLKAFFPFGYLTAGLLKTEWGKGDGTHVIDPLNPLIQKNGVKTDLFEMKRAEAMVMASVYLGENGLLELVYKPYFHPLQSDLAGRWATGMPDTPSPDTTTLTYSQGAARITGTVGACDLGCLYYYGFMSEPGYEVSVVFTGTNLLDPTHYQTVISTVFTRAHLIGLEGAGALGPFTVRTELGYWLTEDADGDQPELYNHRFVYLGGIDLLVPGTGIFAGVQLTGSYTLDFPQAPEIDVDRLASYNGTAHANTLIGVIELPFARDTMKIRLNGLYLFEAEGYMLIPEYRWTINDDLELLLYGQIFGGEDTGGSPYSMWDKNDNIGITITYLF